MKSAIVALALLTSAACFAMDLGNQAPVKTPGFNSPNVPVDPRQGGDLIATALLIPSLPYNDTGTTTGYSNDYDEICPYDGSTAPDVVYEYVATSTVAVDIDLCGSAYDSKLYVYDAAMNLVACNDDFYFGAPCGVYVSKLENVTLTAGTTYYIVIDGYGSGHGEYVLDISVFVPCVLTCLPGWDMEGEPPLVPDYVDNYNGGCNTDPGFPFQWYNGDYDGTGELCGVSGWYTYQGSQYRDTDWYIVSMGYGGTIEVLIDAEQPTYFFELAPQDCAAVGVVQQVTGGPCNPAFMTITGYAYGSPVWVWAGPTVFAPPAGGGDTYDYQLSFSGLEQWGATESAAWGAVKALYR